MDYLILSIILLAIGIYGLLTKHDLVKILISIELIATGASMNFVLLAPLLNKPLGEAFLILAFSTDTCVTAIVLALLLIAAKKYGTSDMRKLAKLKRNSPVKKEDETSSETGRDDV
jgi:NADH:ubiquinone oxidoreductase subunit K